MKTILVTGGCGFIGTNFITKMLLRQPVKIINVDNGSYASNTFIDETFEQFPFYERIECDIAELSPEFLKIDGIINFAAESHVDNSIENPFVFERTNVAGTLNLLHIAKKLNIRYLQVSTDEVYGALDSTAKPFTEEHPINPNSPYSASKASADCFVNAYHKTYGVDTVITRCGNNYGGFQHPEKLIPKIITKALNCENIPVYGDGKQMREWVHVIDHCNAIWHVFENGVSGEIYNVGTENNYENIEIVKKILKIMDKSEDLIEFVEDRLGHDFRYDIDCSKLESIGWKANSDFDATLKQTIDFYTNVENMNYFKQL